MELSRAIVVDSVPKLITFTFTAFIIAGDLPTFRYDYYNTCPGDFPLKGLEARDVAGNEVSGVFAGGIYTFVAKNLAKNPPYCTANEFPCKIGFGRGSLVSISDKPIKCMSDRFKYSRAEIHFNENADQTFSPNRYEMDIIYSGTRIRMKIKEVIEQFDMNTGKKLDFGTVLYFNRNISYRCILMHDFEAQVTYSYENESMSKFVIRQAHGPIIGYGTFIGAN